MEMVVPTLQQAGTYYLWPGLQDVNTTGIKTLMIAYLAKSNS